MSWFKEMVDFILLNLLINLLVRNHVGIFRLLAAPKRAELAVHIADIRIVDIAINAEGDDLITAPTEGVSLGQFAPAMRECAEGFQRQRIKPQCLFRRHTPSFPRLFEKLVHGRIIDHADNLSIIRKKSKKGDRGPLASKLF